MSAVAPIRGLPATPPAPSAEARTVSRDFEALFIGQMLHAARAAQLADDPLAGDDAFRDLQDRQLAQSLAAAAPLGVAKLLE